MTRLKGAPIPKFFIFRKAYLTLEIGKEDKISKILWFQHITEVPTHYCIQQFILSSKILCPHFLLIYTALLTCCGRIMLHSVQPLLKHWGVCNTVIQIIFNFLYGQCIHISWDKTQKCTLLQKINQLRSIRISCKLNINISSE